MEHPSSFTTTINGQSRKEALERAKREAADYFEVKDSDIVIESEHGRLVEHWDHEWNGNDRVPIYKGWHYEITVTCAIDPRPVGIKI